MSVHRGPKRMRGRAGWVVRWRDQATGRNRQRTFDRRSDALRFDGDLRLRRAWGPTAVAQLTGEGLTLNEWMEQRWLPEHGATLQPTTLATYRDVWDCHVRDALGRVPVTRCTASMVRGWQAGVDAPTPTLRKARTVVSSMLRHAAESDVIPANPLLVVRPPRREHAEPVRPFTPLQVERIRAHLIRSASTAAVARRDAAMLSTMAYQGLRPGELRGLWWLDIGEQRLVVARALDPEGKIKPPKTTHGGTVGLLAPAVDDLVAHRRPGDPVDDYVIGFAWSKDDWDWWRRHRWEPAVRAALELAPGTKVPRPYVLRHTFASLLLAGGGAVHLVARELRHTPEQTLNTYGHLFEEWEGRESIDIVAEIFAARAQAMADINPPEQEADRA